MRLRAAWLACASLSLSSCAAARLTVAEPCCRIVEEAVSAPPIAATDEAYDARDYASQVEGPARCAAAAARLLPRDADEAWRQLRGCVDRGHFTALRSLLAGPWDRELQSRHDAPELLARVIAMRGGDVDGDLRLLHDRRVPLFSLSQALAQPRFYRGTLVILRARLSSSGLLDESRLVGAVNDVALRPLERASVNAGDPSWSSESESSTVDRRAYNLDVSSGQRVLLAGTQPFVDPGDVVVVLARFDGLREDAWPTLAIIDHFRPSALVSY